MLVLRICLAALAVLCSAPGPAGANLRAPVSRDSPSSALQRPGAGLTVLGEELLLVCRGQGCRVRANYRLRAAAAGSWRLAFVLPGPGRVTVRSGDSVLQVSSHPVDWSDPRTGTSRQQDQPRMYLLPKMHQAAFDLFLPAGRNLVQISYRQAWGREERKFQGYFSGWLSARTLRYELWPLRQWRLAPGFRLPLSLRVEGEEAKAALLQAAAEPGGAAKNLALLPRLGDGALGLRRRWGRGFPARLKLVVGDAEAIATYGIKPPAGRQEPGPDLEETGRE